MRPRLVVITLAAALALIAATAGSSAPTVVQTNWKIVSATGTTLFAVQGSSGESTYNANILVTWRQTATNANQPGWHVALFNFKSMSNYVPGKSIGQRNPIRDVAATVNGRAESSDPNSGSHSCQLSGAVDKGFFSGSAANEVFLSSSKSGKDLVAIVDGQSPASNLVAPQCAGVSVPRVYDVKREQIKRLPLALVQKTRPGTTVSLVLFRKVPIIEGTATVGSVTEKAKITLKLESGL